MEHDQAQRECTEVVTNWQIRLPDVSSYFTHRDNIKLHPAYTILCANNFLHFWPFKYQQYVSFHRTSLDRQCLNHFSTGDLFPVLHNKAKIIAKTDGSKMAAGLVLNEPLACPIILTTTWLRTFPCVF